jgi:hypothetical protein
LSATDVRVRFDRAEGRLAVSRPGWWVINYPLERIEGLDGKTPNDISQLLFGKPPTAVKNWYVRTPGEPVAEPAEPTGPAPIVPTAPASLVVDGEKFDASDENPGTPDRPLKTIAAAMKRAKPGVVIQVRPGIYREALAASAAGTAEQPIVIEGVRDANGRMPVVSGNDSVKNEAWKAVKGPHVGGDVWRADLWTDGPAPLALNGRRLREGTLVNDLKPGEFCQNRGAREIVFPRLNGGVYPKEGDEQLGVAWRLLKTSTEDGLLDLGEKRGVYYLSSWFWQPPSPPGPGQLVWNADAPRAFEVELSLPGGFRMSRTTSLPFDGQLNPQRVWVNGGLLPAWGVAGGPKPASDYADSGDGVHRATVREGWNHVVLLVDSRPNPRFKNRVGFLHPERKPVWISSASAPADRSRPTQGKPEKWIGEWLVLGPLPDSEATAADRGVYVKDWPYHGTWDMGVRTMLLRLDKPYWTVRGFEFRHGKQFQQGSAVELSAPGVVLEYCQITEPEVRGVTVNLSKMKRSDAAVTVRGNWIQSPGGVGIGAHGSSEALTANTLDDGPEVPGLGRVIVEFNTIVDNNANGYDRWWESGAMKLVQVSGSIVRGNRIVGGDGPGIWYDWENWNNRIEANFATQPTGFLVGIEASPGPHLIANNVAVGVRPGGAWFRYAVMGWSSSRCWAVHNTLDGRFNGNPHENGFGMGFNEGENSRGTRWDRAMAADRSADVVNNLILGSVITLNWSNMRDVEGNLLYDGAHGNNGVFAGDKQVQHLKQTHQYASGEFPPAFPNAARGDYRVPAGSRAAAVGVDHRLLKLFRHDYFGLLRFPEDGRAAGAFRVEPAPAAGEKVQLEIEWADGAVERRWKPAAP